MKIQCCEHSYIDLSLMAENVYLHKVKASDSKVSVAYVVAECTFPSNICFAKLVAVAHSPPPVEAAYSDNFLCIQLPRLCSLHQAFLDVPIQA